MLLASDFGTITAQVNKTFQRTNKYEIIEFFNFYPHLKKYFLGIRNIDTLIKTIPVNHFLICNTDLSTGPGKHWFVLFRYNQRELECFDSLGVGTERQALLRSVQFKSIKKHFI